MARQQVGLQSIRRAGQEQHKVLAEHVLEQIPTVQLQSIMAAEPVDQQEQLQDVIRPITETIMGVLHE